MSCEALSLRELNRALLARQFLLERQTLPALDAIERLVGLQAQLPNTPHIGLWTRLNNFRPEDLSSAIQNRRAVRIALMRSTIHLVTARDCLAFRPILQPMLDRNLYTATPWGGELWAWTRTLSWRQRAAFLKSVLALSASLAVC